MSMQPISTADVFRLSPRTRLAPPLRWGLRGVERALGLDRFQREYERLPAGLDADNFLTTVHQWLGNDLRVEAAELASIPAQGAAVVVANHPFGGLEGILLARQLRQIRPDVRIMANHLLCRVPELQELFIPVDPFGRAGSARANIAPLRQALRWLQGGGLLLVFPAGEVSHLHLRRRRVLDPPWQASIGRLVRLAQAPVVPLYIEGRNTWMFQAAGLVHPRLRTLLLPRQFLNKRGRPVQLRVGGVIPWRRLERYGDDRQLIDYLRLQTYLLGEGGRRSRTVADSPAPGVTGPPADMLAAEVARLPEEQRLAESGDYAVWHARAEQIPYLLLEIGRLREATFRQVGEGTGRDIDLDAYDSHYDHIFLWQLERQEVVGAYRIGRTDVIRRTLGAKGLYSTTLFRYHPALHAAIDPALELGRSFVRSEYQRSYQPLLLLWKGIGGFVVKHPRYRYLFGPVSISRDYSDLSRHLIAGSLLRTSLAEELAPLVKPKTPLRLKPVALPGSREVTPGLWGEDLEELSLLVGDIEGDGRGIPVLLRHYLGLGGKLLAFNVDRDFADVLDGLILVDLLKTERKQLDRYLGRSGAEAFLAWQQHNPRFGRQRCA